MRIPGPLAILAEKLASCHRQAPYRRKLDEWSLGGDSRVETMTRSEHMWTYFSASYSLRYTWMCPATLGFYDLFPGHPVPANRVYALPSSEHWGGVEGSGGCCTTTTSTCSLANLGRFKPVSPSSSSVVPLLSLASEWRLLASSAATSDDWS